MGSTDVSPVRFFSAGQWVGLCMGRTDVSSFLSDVATLLFFFTDKGELKIYVWSYKFNHFFEFPGGLHVKIGQTFK